MLKRGSLMQGSLAPGGAGAIPSATDPVAASGPVYATWTDLTNLVAADNGLEKTAGGNASNTGARSTETMTTGGGVRVTYDDLFVDGSEYIAIGLMNSAAATLTTFPPTISADHRFYMYFLSPTQTRLMDRANIVLDLESTDFTGSTFEMRENSGAIEVLIDDVVEYTYASTPYATHAAMCGMFFQGAKAQNIELTGSWS